MKNLKKIALALGGLSAICAGFAVGTVASTQKAAKPTLATSGMDTTILFLISVMLPPIRFGRAKHLTHVFTPVIQTTTKL
jgi:hypothetical protein